MTDPSEPREDTEPPRRARDLERSMAAYAARSGMRRRADGQLDVLHAVGGWRGLAETILPGVVFLAVLLIGGVLVIGSGIIAAAVGEREFHEIGEEHGEEHEELDVGESGETHDDEGVREDAIGVLVLER